MWSRAEPTTFDTDYAGAATGIVTRVRFAWSPDALHALFELAGAGLFTDTARPIEAERERLYEEDCVELFVTPDGRDRDRYFEIEVGPFGHFFDLDVRKGKKADASFASGVRIGTLRDAAARRAVIEMTIPSPEIKKALGDGARLYVGIYRMEGEKPRRYLAWSPPRTPKPSFHEPEAFGIVELEP
ncbi:MAG: carbohydrate-binding family 9-like protein [Polyangiaceae bacterium]|nr:carbohydrate-binding family 9-like protein [Polyangiaceae bacterium]